MAQWLMPSGTSGSHGRADALLQHCPRSPQTHYASFEPESLTEQAAIL